MHCEFQVLADINHKLPIFELSQIQINLVPDRSPIKKIKGEGFKIQLTE